MTRHGLVMASDSRTNAGYDQVNVARKMHTFVQPGERVFVLLTSGSLSCTQSIITLLRRDFDQGKGLAQAPSLYDAARVIGEQVRRVSDLDRAALERDEYKFNVNLILGGQVRGESPGLFLIYPQGNPLQATEDSPYLQIGETKYGRPILDRGIRFEQTTLEEAAKYALLSLDSTMSSNVTVGPPIDLLRLRGGRARDHAAAPLPADDPDLVKIRIRWEQALRQAVARLPQIRFRASRDGGAAAIAPGRDDPARRARRRRRTRPPSFALKPASARRPERQRRMRHGGISRTWSACPDAGGIIAACDTLSVHAAELWAVLTVETRGCGFLADRRPLILFERHYFSRRPSGSSTRRSRTSATSSGAGIAAGRASTSVWGTRGEARPRGGAPQRLLGTGTGDGGELQSRRVPGRGAHGRRLRGVGERAARRHGALHRRHRRRQAPPRPQLAGLRRRLQWPAAYAQNSYDERLRAAHQKFLTGALPDLDVRAIQAYLVYLDYNPGPVDGVVGRFTRSALRMFQEREEAARARGVRRRHGEGAARARGARGLSARGSGDGYTRLAE